MNLELMEKYPELNSLEAAENLIKSADLTSKKCFLAQGWALTQISEKKLFKPEFDTITEYLNSNRFGYSRRQAYHYIDIYEKYKDYDVQTLHKIGISKLIRLARISDEEEREGLTKQATELSVEEVSDEVKSINTEKLTKEIHRSYQRQDEDVTEGDSQLDKCIRQGRDLIIKLDGLKLTLNELKEMVENWVKFSDKFTETSSLKQEVIKKLEELK